MRAWILGLVLAMGCPDPAAKARALADEAAVAVQEGKLTTAARTYEAALEADPSADAIRLDLAQVLVQDKRHSRARAVLSEVTDPSMRVDVALRTAASFDAQGDIPGAIASLTAAVEAGDDPMLRLARGRLRASRGDAEAAQDLRAAEPAHPVDAGLALAGLALEAGDRDEARRRLDGMASAELTDAQTEQRDALTRRLEGPIRRRPSILGRGFRGFGGSPLGGALPPPPGSASPGEGRLLDGALPPPPSLDDAP